MFTLYNPINSQTKEDSNVQVLLQSLSESWDKRAVVRSKSFYFDDLIPKFNHNADDFLEELLPFKDHPAYLYSSEALKKKILTCGWLIYNEKTLSIENHIVTPACISIMDERVPGLSNRYAKEVASETLVDESYHSLMVLKANNITKELRNIDIKLPQFHLIKKKNAMQESLDADWKLQLTQVATAIVSEVFISDYLKLLSSDHRVQPFNKAVVSAHLKDENTHGAAFKLLTRELYRGLNQEQREFFAEILPKPVRWFADKDLDVWESALEQIGFNQAKNMINDCRKREYDYLESIDYSGIVDLASHIGITSTKKGVSSFQEEGLISGERRLTSKI